MTDESRTTGDDIATRAGVGSRLRNALADTAAAVQVDDPACVIGGVSRRARARRRRSGALLVAASLVVIGGGVATIAAVTGDDGGDRLVTTDEGSDPQVEPVPDDTAPGGTTVTDDGDSADTEVPQEPDVAADGSSVSEAPAPVAPVPAVAEAATTSIFGEGESPVGSPQLVEWHGGLLALSQVYQPQPLPELPPDIVERFPPEAVEYFEQAGGAPATIDEATRMLSDAGLLESVTELLANDPEVSDAIYSESSQGPRLVGRFTTDGRTWDEVDVESPVAAGDGDGGRVASNGESMVLVQPTFDPVNEEPPGDPRSSTTAGLVISRTSDLTTWTSESVDLLDADVPGYVSSYSQVIGAAANSQSWVAVVRVEHDIDVWSLVPDEVRSAVDEDGGASMTYGADGVTIQTGGSGQRVPSADPNSAPPRDGVRTWSFTWEELGVDASYVGRSSTYAVSDEWDAGSTTWIDLSGRSGDAAFRTNEVVVATEEGFVVSGAGPLVSADGRTWEPAALPAVGPSWLVASVDRVVVLTVDVDAVDSDAVSNGRVPLRALEVRPGDGSVHPIPAPDIGFGVPWWSANGSGVVAYDTSEAAVAPARGVVDGVQLEIWWWPSVAGYVVTDFDDGTVLTEGYYSASSPTPDIGFAETESGFEVSLPGRTDPIVFTHEQMQYSDEVGDVAVLPELKLLTLVGDSWIDVELPSGDPNSDGLVEPTDAARIGDAIVVVRYDGSTVRIEF